jgi:twitching motility protein PilT
MQITELVAFAKKHQASDLHLSSNHPPTLRIHGQIVPLRVAALNAVEVGEIVHSIMNDSQRNDYKKYQEIDFAVQFDDETRYRVNAFTDVNGPGVVMREIPLKIRSLEELKLPAVLSRLVKLSKGLILVTGPTGSGKSTTLAAMINAINQTQQRHIITIEDPVEFLHRSQKCLVNQREVGSHTQSFSRALKSALREDPDVILVGELRDIETIRMALTAAETGHLVLATLHTSSAATTIDRVIDVFPPGDKDMVRMMLSTSIEGIIAQLLLRNADGKGRTAVHEILLASSAVRNLIRDHKIPQIYSLMQVGSRVGMCTMRDSVQQVLEKGIISRDEMRSVLNLEGDDNSSANNIADSSSTTRF